MEFKITPMVTMNGKSYVKWDTLSEATMKTKKKKNQDQKTTIQLKKKKSRKKMKKLKKNKSQKTMKKFKKSKSQKTIILNVHKKTMLRKVNK